MKKETILATIFGVILGLIVAFIMIIFLRPSGKEQIEQAKSTLTPKVEKNSNIVPLEIKTPADRSIINKDSVLISGVSKKGSLVIVESPISDEVFVNKNGSFKIDFPLVLGENLITIRSYIDKSQTVPQIKTLKVYYLSEE